MRALVCERLGPPTELVLREHPEPSLAPDEVRIRVAAAGVNFPDALMVRGQYQIKAEPPFIPGSEVAGTIAEVGASIDGWRVGDRVCAMTVHGGFADQVAVKADRLVALPDDIGFFTGSSVLTTHGTAAHALRQRASLVAGERLLVLGAGGGVGLAAVAIGRAMGAEVIAAASLQEKLQLASEHGAHTVLNSAAEDFPGTLRKAGPVDVIFDPVGGTLSEVAFRTIAPGGRHLVVGFASGEIPRIALNLPLLKYASLVGVFWGLFTTRMPEAHRANMSDVFAGLRDGRLPAPAVRVAPLEQGPEVLSLLDQRRIAGKYVLQIGPEDA